MIANNSIPLNYDTSVLINSKIVIPKAYCCCSRGIPLRMDVCRFYWIRKLPDRLNKQLFILCYEYEMNAFENETNNFCISTEKEYFSVVWISIIFFPVVK